MRPFLLKISGSGLKYALQMTDKYFIITSIGVTVIF